MRDDLIIGLWGRVLRRATYVVCGAFGLNPFVYNALRAAKIKRPDISVGVPEFYGQCGEDLIVLSLLRARVLSTNASLDGRRYLEIGGNHPFATSATFLLNRELGMTGAIVEANPKLLGDLRAGRPDDIIINGAVQVDDNETVFLTVSKLSELSSIDSEFISKWDGAWAESVGRVEVPAFRINQIIGRHFGGVAPVFLSIDVEGIDFQILQDLDLSRYRPWLIQIEPSDRNIPGNSKAIIDYMGTACYGLIAQTPVNLIFGDLLSQS